jgi:hypothetical protein
VSAGAEYLVMGYLMRRNILAYKAPQNNEGYDLICNTPTRGIRRPATSRPRCACRSKAGMPATATAAFPSSRHHFGKKDCGPDRYKPEFYTLPKDFAMRYQDPRSNWGLVKLRAIQDELEQYRDERGFELIAQKLGIPKPARPERVRAR